MLTQCWDLRMLQKYFSRSWDIIQWKRSILETGDIGHRSGNGRPEKGENLSKMPKAFHRLIPPSVVVWLPAKYNFLLPGISDSAPVSFSFPHSFQNLEALNERDSQRRLQFAYHCSTKLEDYAEYLSKQNYSDEIKSRISSVVNKPNVRIWGIECRNEY